MGFVIPKNYLKEFGDSFTVSIEKTLNGLLIKPVEPKALTLKELIASTDMKKMYKQLEKDANNSKTRAYYKSKEVKDSDNANDIIDEY